MSLSDFEEAKSLVPRYPYADRATLERSETDRQNFYSTYGLRLTPEEDAQFVDWLARG